MALTYAQAFRIAASNLLETCYTERFEGFKENSKNKMKFDRSSWKMPEDAENAAFINIVGLEMVKT